MRRKSIVVMSLCLSVFLSGTVLADALPAVVKQLTTKDLAGAAGKEVLMSTVTYPPGGASPPHRHDAQVFVYVLEGELIMQVQGGPKVTLKPGETFYESPSDVHSVSANASQTAPAKFLVFIIKDKGAPTTRAATP
ncbi:MAG TPA: cupin domain-containing protein [Steroidobacteraceae bacterium]|jgi:quercetin dioxygenase-like cupin family protein|nr:cupin domain-containing protein [Steroidobacteraceae bacterium]